jgi:hypothetical protein
MKKTMTWGTVVLCAAALSCSRGGGAKPGAGEAARPGGSTDLLIEGTGLANLRIDEATLAQAAKSLGLSAAEGRTATNGVVELRVPPFLKLFFAPSVGGGEPRLYAARAGLWEPVYTGKTSKGIGFLDSGNAMREAYGQPEAVWVGTNEKIHYYAQQGVIFSTQHPRDVVPKIYAQARAALGKQPGEGPEAEIVTAIMVVRPFTVIQGAETMMARQQVISTRPKTDLLISEF